MRTCTVVIPAYNPDPDALNRALARLLLMPQAKHIIVVDDGSDPPLHDRDAPLSAKRVTLLHQPNAGVSAARNTGLDHALRHDDPIYLLDADDEPRPGLVHALELLEKHDAACVCSAREERTPIGDVTIKGLPPAWKSQTLPHPADVFRPIALFGASGVVVARRVIKAGLRFDAGLSHGEDRDFLRRCAELGPVALNDDPALLVAIHDDNANNLTSAAHDVRRARAMRTIVDRWCDERSEPHFRESARWLLNRCAKRGAPAEAWSALIGMHKDRRWPVPLKARLRRLITPAVS